MVLTLFRKTLSWQFSRDKAAPSIASPASKTSDDRDIPFHAPASTKIPRLISQVHAQKVRHPHDVFQRSYPTYNRRIPDKVPASAYPPSLQQKLHLGAHRIRPTRRLESCLYRAPQIFLSAVTQSLSSKASPQYLDAANSIEVSEPFREDVEEVENHLHSEQASRAGLLETMATTSKKRKLDESAPTKYYAVRAGHTPGVYTSWSDCQESITGFKGANCRS